MWINLWNDINDWFIEVTKDIRLFFLEHCRNPLLWIAIIVIALVIFESVYRALHRD